MTGDIPPAGHAFEPPSRKRRLLKLPPLLVGANGVARMLDCGLRTIRSMDSAGKLPMPIRLGGRVLWSVDELKDWIRAGCPDRAAWAHIRRHTC